MRLFVGIFPPPAAVDDLRLHLAGSPGLTPADRWHITLAFLGEITDDRVPDVTRALSTVPARGAIEARLVGGGSFGHVLWAGVEARLAGMNAAVCAALAQAGLPYDERPFTPHLTVSYVGRPEVRDALTGYTGPSWQAREFALVRSANGYRTLGTWPL